MTVSTPPETLTIFLEISAVTTRPVLLSRPVTRSPTSASMPSGMSTSMVLVFRSSWNFCLPLSSSSSASALDNSYVAVRSSRPLRVCVWLNVPFASAYQWMTVRSLSSPLPRQMRWLIGCAACLAVKSIRSESMLSPIVRTGMALMATLSPSLRNRSLSPLALSILTRPLYRSTYRSNWQVVLWSALSSVTVNRPCNPARLTSVRMMTGIVPDRVR